MCLALKDRVQDYIYSNLLHVPPRDKKAKISNNSNSDCKGKKNDYPSSSENTYSSNSVGTFDLSEILAMGNRKQLRKNFTPIGISYDDAFDRLHPKKLITPIGPIQDPPLEKRVPSWNPNVRCKYHQGRGHATESCWKLKEDIQRLIDNNKLPIPLVNKKNE